MSLWTTAVASRREVLTPRPNVSEALRDGEKNKPQKPLSRQPVGRFGFGLSQTGICLSNRTLVYSKTEEGRVEVRLSGRGGAGGRWCQASKRSIGHPPLPAAKEVTEEGLTPGHGVVPTGFELPTGTIVSLHDIHRRDYGSVEALVEDPEADPSQDPQVPHWEGCPSRRAGHGEGQKTPD